MSTSTEQINTLIGGYTDLKSYFEGAKDQINADLNAAEVRVGDTRRVFYVDQINGSDANGSGSQAAPFQTLQHAASRSTWNGDLEIILLADYVHDKNLYFRGGGVTIRSDSNNPKRTLSFAPQVDDTYAITPRLAHPNTGGSFAFVNVILEAGTAAAHVTSKHMIACHALTTMHFLFCDFVLPAGSDQKVFRHYHGFGLSLQSCTYPAEMPGRWCEGVAAGTSAITLRETAYCSLATL